MGILHYSDRQRGIVFVVWNGKVTWDEWRQHIHQLLADPDWRTTTRFLVDLQTVTDTSSIGDREIEEVRSVFAGDQAALEGKRAAIIALDEFRRASRFAEFIERFSRSAIVFNHLDTACLFLDIDLGEARQVLDQLRLQLRGSAGS